MRPEHMPEAHVAVVRSVEALIDMVALAGPKSKQLAEHIASHCPTRVTRRFLTGMSSMAKRLGTDLFEECVRFLNRVNGVLKVVNTPFLIFVNGAQNLSTRCADWHSVFM